MGVQGGVHSSIRSQNIILPRLYRLDWLDDFKKWLIEWKSLSSSKEFGLTIDTNKAFIQTANAMSKIVPYLFEQNIDMEFLMLGKLQSDPIEHKFGKYRQMSGGQYRVGCRQTLENEKKHRIRKTPRKTRKNDDYV
jgi:hypothetical protein